MPVVDNHNIVGNNPILIETVKAAYTLQRALVLLVGIGMIDDDICLYYHILNSPSAYSPLTNTPRLNSIIMVIIDIKTVLNDVMPVNTMITEGPYPIP